MVRIVRTYTATVQKKCCRDGEIVYDPPDRDFEFTDIKDSKVGFKYSLVIWKDKIEEYLEKLADKECRKKGTPKLCYFKIKKAKVTEMRQKEAELMEYYEERIKEYKERLEELEKAPIETEI